MSRDAASDEATSVGHGTSGAALSRSTARLHVLAEMSRAFAMVARINIHSFVVVPIRARQTTIGTLSLFRSGPDRGYTTEDLTMMQDVADRSGLAIENARLYAHLERRVQQRTAELEAVNKELE